MPRHKQFDPEDVLLKAMGLFWNKGYNGTSMEDLVQVMGINRASLYSTYGDKHDLFLKALECYRQKTLRPQIAQMCESGDILAYLENLLRPADLNAPCVEGGPLTLGCFVANCVTEIGSSDPEIVKLSHQILHEIRASIAAGIAQEISANTWKPNTNPQEASGLILTVLMGIRVLNRTGMDLQWALASLGMLRSSLKCKV